MYDAVDVPYLRQQSVTTPAVGTDWRYTCPGQGVQRVIALRAVLTTSVAGFNRAPILTLSDGDADYAAMPPGSSLAVSSSSAYSSVAGLPAVATIGATIGWPSPTDGWLLLPGWSIRAVTQNLDVGDQWSAIRLWVVEYPTGPQWRLTPDVYTIIEPKG